MHGTTVKTSFHVSVAADSGARGVYNTAAQHLYIVKLTIGVNYTMLFVFAVVIFHPHIFLRKAPKF
jgi:hypothetical protein